jgi:hypothetical protein
MNFIPDAGEIALQVQRIALESPPCFIQSPPLRQTGVAGSPKLCFLREIRPTPPIVLAGGGGAGRKKTLDLLPLLALCQFVAWRKVSSPVLVLSLRSSASSAVFCSTLTPEDAEERRERSAEVLMGPRLDTHREAVLHRRISLASSRRLRNPFSSPGAGSTSGVAMPTALMALPSTYAISGLFR